MNEICVGRPNHFEWGEVSKEKEMRILKQFNDSFYKTLERSFWQHFVLILIYTYIHIYNIEKYRVDDK